MRKILAALVLLATASVLVVPAAAQESPARASKTLDKATYELAQDAPVAASDAAHQLEDASGRCFKQTARYLLDQLPTGRNGPGLTCRPPAELTGPVGGSGRGVQRLCPTTECPQVLSYVKTPGHIEQWMYPVQTADFYGFHCAKDLDEQPEGKPGVNGGPPGIFNGVGDMTHSPVISLMWCTGGGMIRPGSTVACSGIPSYPYFGRVTCSWSITPWFKPARTVRAHFVFTGGSVTRTADFTATLVAGVPRDVLVIEWDWQL